MEYRITLAIDHCTALTFRFLAASWWKIHSHVVEFLSAIFTHFYVCLYIPRVSSYSSVWSLQGSSYICISVKLDLFRYPARDRKSPPQRRNVAKYFSRKEVDLARFLFHRQCIYHQKSINIQQSFRLGRRPTLYREGLININRKLDKGDVTWDDLRRRFLAQHIISTLLRHCFEWWQHCFKVATLCCAKNRRCESFRVESP